MQTQGVGAVHHQVHDKYSPNENIVNAEEKKNNATAEAEAYWTHSSIREIHAENNAIGIGGGLRSMGYNG